MAKEWEAFANKWLVPVLLVLLCMSVEFNHFKDAVKIFSKLVLWLYFLLIFLNRSEVSVSVAVNSKSELGTPVDSGCRTFVSA